MKRALFILVLSLAQSLAASANEAPARKCKELQPRKLAVGSGCVTSSGAPFKLRVRAKGGREVWEDLSSGLLWGDRLPARHDREEAKEACARSKDPGPGARLPTREELEQAESRGFREALPDMQDRFYWSSTAVPGSPAVRYVFNGNFGTSFVVMYNNIPYESVRCVAQASSK